MLLWLISRQRKVDGMNWELSESEQRLPRKSNCSGGKFSWPHSWWALLLSSSSALVGWLCRAGWDVPSELCRAPGAGNSVVQEIVCAGTVAFAGCLGSWGQQWGVGSIPPSKCWAVSGAYGDRWVGWVRGSGLSYCHQGLWLICPACHDEVINLDDTRCSPAFGTPE